MSDRDTPRQRLLDALIAERFSVYIQPKAPPVTSSEATLNTLDLVRVIEDTDRYDRPMRLVVDNTEEAS